MRTAFSFTFVGGLTLSLICFTGCGSQDAASEVVLDAPIQITGLPPDMIQAHPHEGPHGGHIIELGRNHQYHAELVEHGSIQTVTVYILDKDLKDYPISKPTITLVLTVDGSSKTFELRAVGVSEGMTARFDASDSSLHAAMEASEEAEGKLRVTIDGVPYIGRIAHNGHAYDHGTHKH